MVKEEIVFENELRKMIYNLINNYPGVSFNTLINVFELSESGLRYHLDYLEKCEKIIIRMENGRRNYYPKFDINNINKILPPHLGRYNLNSKQRYLLEIIACAPGIAQKELLWRTKLTRSQVTKNLKKLLELNLIKKIEIDRKMHYQIIPDNELRSKIIKRLMYKFINKEIDEETLFKILKTIE